jgi:hypothetical protein
VAPRAGWWRESREQGAGSREQGAGKKFFCVGKARVDSLCSGKCFFLFRKLIRIFFF